MMLSVVKQLTEFVTVILCTFIGYVSRRNVYRLPSIYFIYYNLVFLTTIRRPNSRIPYDFISYKFILFYLCTFRMFTETSHRLFLNATIKRYILYTKLMC